MAADPPRAHRLARYYGELVERGKLDEEDCIEVLLQWSLRLHYDPGSWSPQKKCWVYQDPALSGLEARLRSTLRASAAEVRRQRSSATWAIRHAVRPRLRTWTPFDDLFVEAAKQSIAHGDKLDAREIYRLVRDEVQHWMSVIGRNRQVRARA